LTTYFSILDFGYGSAQVKFAAEYRARRDAESLNEIASTLFVLFLGVALLTLAAAGVLAVFLPRLFRLKPDEVVRGRAILLIASTYVALSFPFSVFGAIVNGFQRFYLNSTVAIATALAVAAVNYATLSFGYGLVTLVAATTAVRLISLLAYRRTAYRAFPLLKIRLGRAGRARLAEVSAFSVFLLVIDVASKINYASDTMVIGAFMSTVAVAVWSVAARLIDVPRLLSGGLARFLFPTVVGSATLDREERLQLLLIQGTRLSLATVVPMAWVIGILAGPTVAAWVGPKFAGAVPIVWTLAAVVTIRIGTSVAETVLKGCGRHRFVAGTSLGVAVANLTLSIVLVRWLGLVGVALGTLLPVAVVCGGVLFPAACRRVSLAPRAVIRQAVWPAVWPMLPVGLLLWLARPFVGNSLIGLSAAALAAGLLYVAGFLTLGLGPEDRAWYLRRGRRFIPVGAPHEAALDRA